MTRLLLIASTGLALAFASSAHAQVRQDPNGAFSTAGSRIVSASGAVGSAFLGGAAGGTDANEGVSRRAKAQQAAREARAKARAAAEQAGSASDAKTAKDAAEAAAKPETQQQPG